MKFFIDTANIEEIKEGLALGMVDGVTTNPSLIAKEKKDFDAVIKDILKIVKGPVSLEVLSNDAKGMISEGRKLARLGKNVVIKVPISTEGLKATRMFADAGINVNQTLIFSPLQALMAAKAGARYVSPFVGRLDDVGWTGMDLIRSIVNIYKIHGFPTQVLAASVRSPTHVVDAAAAGAQIATMPLKVLDMLFNHPLTDKGLEQFLKDWAKVFQEAPVAG